MKMESLDEFDEVTSCGRFERDCRLSYEMSIDDGAIWSISLIIVSVIANVTWEEKYWHTILQGNSTNREILILIS